MYTPAMRGLFGAMLGQEHPLVNLQSPMTPPGGPWDNVPQMQPPMVDAAALAAPMNAAINVQAPLPAIHPTFMQHIQSFMQNNPGMMQGLMGVFQQPQQQDFLAAPGLGMTPGGGQPWGGRGY